MKSGLLAVLLTFSTAVADTWPALRGPQGNGHSAATGLAVTWSDTENVTWKTAIPNLGYSTPLVWGQQIWLTAATEDGHDYFVYCLDRQTGKILHEAKLFHSDKPEPLGNGLNCYAAPTGLVEEGRVFVHFGSYGTACIDTKTFAVLWQRTDLPCRHYRGPGSSLFDWKDTIIVTMDGVDVQYIAALDKKTGQTRWKTDRNTEFNDLDETGKPKMEGDLRKAYSSPVAIEVGGKPQIVCTASKATIGYDPDTGKELWRTKYDGFSNASLPVWKDGLLIYDTGHGKPNLRAVKITPETSGDITGQIVWEQTKYVPARSSPVIVGDLLHMIADNGFISALDLKDGTALYSERTNGACSASPLVAEGRLYFANERGEVIVVKHGRTWELLATNRMDAGMMASPVAVGSELYIRTRKSLYRIEEKK